MLWIALKFHKISQNAPKTPKLPRIILKSLQLMQSISRGLTTGLYLVALVILRFWVSFSERSEEMIGLDGFFNDVTVTDRHFLCGQTFPSEARNLIGWWNDVIVTHRQNFISYLTKSSILKFSYEVSFTEAVIGSKKSCCHSYGKINELFWNRSFCVLILNGIFYRLKNLIAKKFKTAKSDQITPKQEEYLIWFFIIHITLHHAYFPLFIVT